MAVAPGPREIYERAVEEGRRRLDMTPIEQGATGFIAGVTIIFGIVALGVVESALADVGHGVATVAGALAFAIGVVFVVVGRAELFTENFFDPVATAITESSPHVWRRLARLWLLTLVLNLVGGAVLVGVLTVDGALPAGAAETLVRIAEGIVDKAPLATFARAVLAGALITLLSYLLEATNTVAARIPLSYMVGFFLALGPFDHVIVSALHILFGVWLSGTVSYTQLAVNIGVATAGNLVGGLGLVTLTHTAQVKAMRG